MTTSCIDKGDDEDADWVAEEASHGTHAYIVNAACP